MNNPFESLGTTGPDEVEYEEVTGAFTCEECWTVVHTAKYIESVAVLTWICPCGHISKIEGFE